MYALVNNFFRKVGCFRLLLKLCQLSQKPTELNDKICFQSDILRQNIKFFIHPCMGLTFYNFYSCFSKHFCEFFPFTTVAAAMQSVKLLNFYLTVGLVSIMRLSLVFENINDHFKLDQMVKHLKARSFFQTEISASGHNTIPRRNKR